MFRIGDIVKSSSSGKTYRILDIADGEYKVVITETTANSKMKVGDVLHYDMYTLEMFCELTKDYKNYNINQLNV